MVARRTREPVLLVMSILAGLQLLVTSAEWSDVVPAPWGKLAALAVAGATFGLAFYVRGRVSPVASGSYRPPWPPDPQVGGPVRPQIPDGPVGRPDP